MLLWKRTIVLMLIWGLILGWIAMKGQAHSALTPQDLVRQVRQHFDALSDYSCQFVTSDTKKGQLRTETHNYYFKKPQLIRLEVTSGKDKGAVCIFNKKGKVRAHAGGILGIIKITMEPNDKRLQDDDGSTFVDSHLGGNIKDLETELSSGTATISEIERGRKLLQLQIDRGDKRSIVLIDPQLMLPIEWQHIRNGQFAGKTEWKDLKVNTSLPDSLFEM